MMRYIVECEYRVEGIFVREKVLLSWSLATIAENLTNFSPSVITNFNFTN